MRIVFEVILVTGIFGGFFGDYVSALPVAHHQVVERDEGRTVDEMYKSYIAVSNDRADSSNKVDVISRVQQVYLDNPQSRAAKNVKQQKSKTAYFLLKSMRQRNKRYISYLTLCHFKICNMGRKRTARYFHMIRRQDDNDS